MSLTASPSLPHTDGEATIKKARGLLGGDRDGEGISPTKKRVKTVIAPSVLDCDKANWGRDLRAAMEGGADTLHFDVMDGHFVPNLSFGPSTIGSLRKSFPEVFFDCHFMVTNPEDHVKWLYDAAKASVETPLLGFTFHIEVSAGGAREEAGRERTLKLIESIREKKMRVGIALSPDTPVDTVLPYASQVDMILVMTVRPGMGGQSFMSECLKKVSKLRSEFPTLDIQVDGGVKPGETAKASAEAGANVIVSGSGVFMNKDGVRHAITELRKNVEG